MMSEAAFVPQNYFRELKKEELFPDVSRPLEVDLGCGDGRFLLAMAAQHPERDFLGVERMLGRYDKVAKRISQAGLTNARVLRLESCYTVAWLLPTASVSRLHLLCPDPWPKTKHHRRRLVVNGEFQQGLQRLLMPAGEFLLKTDDPDYYFAAAEHFDGLSAFMRLDWPEDAFFHPPTDFELQWLRIGRSMHRARWQLRG